jgi:hypothetical protein
VLRAREKVAMKRVSKKFNVFECRFRSFLSNLVWSEAASEKMSDGSGFFHAQFVTHSILGERGAQKKENTFEEKPLTFLSTLFVGGWAVRRGERGSLAFSTYIDTDRITA